MKPRMRAIALLRITALLMPQVAASQELTIHKNQLYWGLGGGHTWRGMLVVMGYCLVQWEGERKELQTRRSCLGS